MIGIQGENGLEEVTKSPCDTSLDANSTNAVENRVVTAEFGRMKKTQKVITTDGVGVANLGISVDDYIVLSCYTPSQIYVIQPFLSGKNWYIKVVTYNGFTVATNTQVTVGVLYYKHS